MSEMTVTSHAATRRDAPPQENIKDTIESIVVALILAFVFRAFVVEAFVIPTGSMAPTLYGAHGTIACEDCGTEFAYGLRDLNDQRRANQVNANARIHCPNCNHPNTDLKINDVLRNPEKGDRILVLKWPFDIGGPMLDPARWDVIVFKDPADGVTNFIKRLVGLPNEVLTIIDGDVFTVPTDRLTEAALQELHRYRRDKFLHRTEQAVDRLEPIDKTTWEELEQKLTVVRKTPAAQEVMWTVVYNHDYPPRELDSYQPRWTADLGEASGWGDLASRRLRFEDHDQTGDYVELTNKLIRATTVYNVRPEVGVPPVADLRVRFVWTPTDLESTLLVRLQKRGRTIWARVRGDGHAALFESVGLPSESSEAMVSAIFDELIPGEPVEIAFQNLDYRLSLRVGEHVLTSSDDPKSEAYYGPNVKSLRAAELRKVNHRATTTKPDTPRIYGVAGAFELNHLVVDRDVYYFLDRRSSGLRPRWAPRLGWGSALTPILLRGHEYFMLGDNTAASKDSRLWDETGRHLQSRGEDFQLGTVPRDQLIGKAFFVYWPSGHRLDWLPLPVVNKLGVIPDVGRMRWIR